MVQLQFVAQHIDPLLQRLHAVCKLNVICKKCPRRNIQYLLHGGAQYAKLMLRRAG